MEPPLALPSHRELSPHSLRFLEEHIRSHEDLSSRAPNLETSLKENCADLDTSLTKLHKHLTKLIVSWISLSVTAKNVLHRFNFKLHNPSLCTSEYGTDSKEMRKILDADLPQLAREIQRIETVRNYAETTLKLEALVGDLEDVVLNIMNRHTQSLFSAKLSNPSYPVDSGVKHEKLIQAVKTMNGIEEVLINVTKCQPQWHHLLKSVDTRVDKIMAVLRPHVLADHRVLLASIGWPPKLLTSNIESDEISELSNPLLLMRGDKRKCYSQSILVLCALQHLQTLREDRQLNRLKEKNNEYNTELWAIDELVSPIASRTEYHFLKWVDQPEFIFALVHRITRDLVVGVDDVLQPLIDQARLGSYSAKEAWISAMVQMLVGFLAKRVFSVFAERYKKKHLKSEVISSWLHLIDLIVGFDKRMQALLYSEPGVYEGLSRGGISVLSVFRNRPDWIKIWAKVELKDAWKKLKAELKDENAWFVNNKGRVEFPIEDYKAPSIAVSSIKIAWEMIERCQSLETILLRTRFIRSTASRFFWHFFNILVLGYKKPEFSTVHLDHNALMRVCGSINAAKYIKSKLQEWSDDVTFLEMRIAETGSIVSDDICFFSEEIKTLSELETNWLMQIITDLLYQFESLSWEYIQNNGYFEELSASMDISLSINIVEALDSLRNQLRVIEPILNSKDFLDLWRSLADGLDHFIFGTVLSSDIRFSDVGVSRFGSDMQALFLIFQPYCLRPEAFFPLIRDSLTILKLDKEDVKRFQVGSFNNEDRIECLPHCKISHLSFDQVEKILRMRMF